MAKPSYFFRSLSKRTKLTLLRAAILAAAAILLSVRVTRTAIIGVFGYMSYGYLAIGVIVFFADIIKKGKWAKRPPKTTALYIATLLSIVLTVHISFLKDAAGKGFGDYIAAVYNKPSTGGVVMSLISAPVVLPFKFAASSVIFFLLSVTLGFLSIYPYIFQTVKKRKSAPAAKEKEAVTAEIKKEKTQKADEKNLLERLRLTEEKAPVLSYTDAQEEAGKKLFGTSYVREIPDVPKAGEIVPPAMFKSKAKNPYFITDEIEAIKIKPDSSLYMNKYDQKRRSDAVKKLGLDDFGKYQESLTEKEPVIMDEVKPILTMDEYEPAKVLFDDTIADVGQTAETDEPFDADFGGAPEEIYEVVTEKVYEREPETAIMVASKRDKSNKKTILISENERLALDLPYQFPSKSKLIDHSEKAKGFVPYVDNADELRDVIEVKLKNYNIDARFVDAIKGPTITRCVVELSDKCPISRVIAAKADINRLLMTKQEITILPQMDDSTYFGIDVPNKVRGIVSFKEVISSKEYAEAKGDIVLALGKTAEGSILIEDLADMPHALIAGTTGSGKSVCINVILASILYRYSPDEVKLLLIDLKRVEMELFGGLPHMLVEKPLNDVNEILNALRWLREETERRYIAFRGVHARKLSEYNKIVDEKLKLPRVVVIIDEASELMTNPAVRKPIEASLSSLARVARAAGVHLIFATQNPVKEVITNEIQNNLNTKIAFAVGDYNHSMVIFKAKGAESLLGNGDMYIKRGKDMVRGQCAYISSEEVDEIVRDIKKNNTVEFDYDAIERILRGSKEELAAAGNTGSLANLYAPEPAAPAGDEKEELIKDTLRICVESGRASCSLVQRKLQKGYNTIANVMDYLETKGWVSEQVNNKRTLLISKEEFYAMYPELTDDGQV